MKLGIDDILRVTNGTPGPGHQTPPEGLEFRSYHFDTRHIAEPGALFFALKGESSDGHRFIPQIQDKPGIGAVVDRDFDATGIHIPLIRVDDPLRAAQQLAAHVRRTRRRVKYIGVTGSAGKTTTKEFIYQLLSTKGKSYRSAGNWNNWIGLPFSLLNMEGDEDTAVFELAMSSPGIGEINTLADILRPDIAVILNVYPVHLEFLKTLEKTAHAKAEILNYLAADDIGLINGDCEYLTRELARKGDHKGHIVTFGRRKNNPIRLKAVTRDDTGNQSRMRIEFYGIEHEFTLPLVSHVHLENAFAAIITAHHLGMKHVEIQAALPGLTPLTDRGGIRKSGPFVIIDETYNSNPEAAKKMLRWVSEEYGQQSKDPKSAVKIAVLGDMLELGPLEADFHRDLGRFLAGLNFDHLIAVGERARHIAEGAANSGLDPARVHRFDTAVEAGKYLHSLAPELRRQNRDTVLLFKASRGIGLEKAVKEFLNE